MNIPGDETRQADNDSQSAGSSPRAGLTESLKREGRERVENGKRLAAEQIEDLADAIDMAGSHLDRSQPTIAGYAGRLADGVAGVAKRLREGSIEDLGRDARQLATRNPTMFLLGGVALGIAVAHLLKASSESAGDSGHGNGQWNPHGEPATGSRANGGDRLGV